MTERTISMQKLQDYDSLWMIFGDQILAWWPWEDVPDDAPVHHEIFVKTNPKPTAPLVDWLTRPPDLPAATRLLLAVFCSDLNEGEFMEFARELAKDCPIVQEQLDDDDEMSVMHGERLPAACLAWNVSCTARTDWMFKHSPGCLNDLPTLQAAARKQIDLLVKIMKNEENTENGGNLQATEYSDVPVHLEPR
jgi:hypothetical protein